MKTESPTNMIVGYSMQHQNTAIKKVYNVLFGNLTHIIKAKT